MKDYEQEGILIFGVVTLSFLILGIFAFGILVPVGVPTDIQVLITLQQTVLFLVVGTTSGGIAGIIWIIYNARRKKEPVNIAPPLNP